MRPVRRGRGRRAASRLRAIADNTDTRVDEDNTGLVVYRLLVVRVNPYNDTAMATGSGREMVRRAAFYPRRGGGGVFWAGVRRREARLPRGVLSGWERRRWRASGGSGVRRSSSGGGGCGDDRPSRAGGAGLVLS